MTNLNTEVPKSKQQKLHIIVAEWLRNPGKRQETPVKEKPIHIGDSRIR
jgi:hypothetical protein